MVEFCSDYISNSQLFQMDDWFNCKQYRYLFQNLLFKTESFNT